MNKDDKTNLKIEKIVDKLLAELDSLTPENGNLSGVISVTMNMGLYAGELLKNNSYPKPIEEVLVTIYSHSLVLKNKTQESFEHIKTDPWYYKKP